MSLLMQALKKAEDAKQRQKQGPAPAVGQPGPETAAQDPIGFGGFTLLDPDPPAAAASQPAPWAPDLPPVQEPADAVPVPLSLLADAPVPAMHQSDPVALVEEIATNAVAPEAASASSATGYTAAPDLPFDVMPVPEAVATPEAPTPPPGAPSQQAVPASAAEVRRAAEPARQTEAQQAARRVFAANAPEPRRRRLVLAAAALGLALTAIGGWFAYELTGTTSSIATPQLAPAPVPPAMAAPDAVPATADTGTQVPAASADQQAVPVAPPQAEAATAAAPVAAPVAAATGAPAPASAAPATPVLPAAPAAAATRVPATALVPAEAPYVVDRSGIEIKRGSEPPQAGRAAMLGYQAFNAGDYAGAEQQYRRALQQDPTSRDAMLGMAALALRQQRAEQAAAWYARLLEADPADPDAVAGLTGLQRGDAAQDESRLKKILALHPQAAALHFALGNVYARQSRWADAQQAYFRAYTGAPGNPDYAFNLGVSLDNLQQPRLALDYYQKALRLAASAPASFGAAAVQARVAELQSLAEQ
ncbi:MAG TPA: tetratricopeptide repeat protein [Noviherbaspirillum sp.]|jgi:Tfp pilus assembly protein PilF|uniref:tetratricopeptide repeat protein n=1 Tax=Noviherbaspirillum sp. TaxID=1926288 RepID=UPI002F941186